MIIIDMINIVFLFLAEVLEFVAVVLSLPAKIVGDVASFCYGASRAIDNYENNDPDQEENE